MRTLGLFLLLSCLASVQAETLTFRQMLTLIPQSPAVQAAAQDVELAGRARDIERSPLNLNLGGGVRAGAGSVVIGNDGLPIADTGPIALDPITLSATLNVVPLGPNVTAGERVDAAVTQAETFYQDAREDTLLAAIEAYLNALRNAQQQNVLRRGAGVARFALDGVRAKLEAGAAGEAEVLKAQLDLAQAQSDLATSLREGAEALGTLTSVLGVAVDGVTGSVTVEPVLEPGDLDSQLERRGDVMRARLALRDAELAEADTRFGLLPSGTASVGYTRSVGGQEVALGASVGSDSAFQPSVSVGYQPFGTATDGGAFSASLGVSVPLDPVTPKVLEMAALRVTQARTDLTNTLALARLELGSRQRELAAAKASLDLAARQLGLSGQLLAGVQKRFALGLIAPLELKQAQQGRLAAQLTQARVQDAVLLAQLRLARALALNLEDLL